MKRLIYTFALFFVSLFAMGANLGANKYIYFANTDGWTTSTIQFMIGHSSWSQGYGMTKISNTNLYYWKSIKWDNYTQWAVFGTDGVWGGEGSSISHRKGYANKSTEVGTTSITANYNLITTAGAIGSTGTSHTFLNKTHTIKSYVDDVESSAGGTVSASSYKLNSATATTATNGTTSIEAVYTATIKLTTTVNDGYEFIGWYDGSTELSTKTTYSYTAPNSAQTISAKFRKLAVAEPRIVSFSASSSEIDLDQSVTFDVEVENADKNDVVFKNGNIVISNPWTPTEGGVYNITANLDGATSKSVEVTVYAATIYFDNTVSGWSNVYAYCWNSDSDKNENWPGVKLTNPVENTYTYKSTKIYKNVIFTNNSEQTPDLIFVNGETYSMPKPIPVVAGDISLCGTSWDVESEENKMEEVDGVFVKTYTNVPVGTHKFKIVYKGNWLGHYNRFSSEYSSTCTNDNDDNIQFTLDATATVIISYNNSTDKIELKVVYDNFEVGDEIYFSSDQGASPYAAYLFGESGETWVKLSQKYTNIYSATVPNGNWGGVIFCSMKSETLNRANIDSKTKYLEYEGKNWYKWTDKSEWRNFENLIYAGQKLYFKPDSNWEADGARFAAYYWDVLGENRWADCVYDSVDHAYNVVAPTVGDGVNRMVWTNIKFVRINPKYNENGWNDATIKDRVWDETPDLVYDGANDFFIVKLTKKDGSVWDWNSADPENWISFSHPFKGVIFFEPNASLKATANKRFSIYLWNGFDDNCWVKMQPLATHLGIYCVVVPEGYWTGANICSMNPATTENNWENKLLQTDNLTYNRDKLLYKAPDAWSDKAIGDENWCVLTNEIDFDPDVVMEIAGGVANGAYYQAKKYTLSIAGSEVNKWHWISLPYNVNVKDIKSNITAENPYGVDFIMKRYDTANRAAWEAEQAPADDKTWVQLEATDVLETGRGYILGIDNSLTEGVTLTFPANDYFHVVAERVESKNDDYSSGLAVNSNWHLIGTGLYAESQSSSDVNFVAYPDESGSDYTYHYLNSDEDLQYHETTLKSTLGMYKAFFVQYGGEYSFSKVATVQNMAPRRARAEEVIEQYYINIAGEKDATRTAIFLADDGSDDYIVGKDFLHFGVTGKTTQIYTKQGSRLLAFNHLKREDCVVELGGYIVDAGEYTISLTDNGASSVILIDNYTGESVDLSIENYTFTTKKGSLDGRFMLAIAYVEKDVTTQVGNDLAGDLVVSNNGGLTMVGGLSVGDEVWIYDTVGRCVDQFVADSEQVELNIAAGIYVLKTSMESVKFIVW